MFNIAERTDDALLQRNPADTCCGYLCCRRQQSLRTGVLWTCAGIILESIWHITISVLRPGWEWQSTAVTVIAFVCQDIVRLAALVCSSLAILAIKKHTKKDSAESDSPETVISRLGLLFKFLVALICFELLEMTVKFYEVATVCDAPYVSEARRKRWNASHHREMTPAELSAAQSRCRLISDIYDYFWAIITIALLVYLTWIVHSYKRSIHGPGKFEPMAGGSQPET
eukprot:g4768.t1